MTPLWNDYSFSYPDERISMQRTEDRKLHQAVFVNAVIFRAPGTWELWSWYRYISLPMFIEETHVLRVLRIQIWESPYPEEFAGWWERLRNNHTACRKCSKRSLGNVVEVGGGGSNFTLSHRSRWEIGFYRDVLRDRQKLIREKQGGDAWVPW